MKIIAEIGQNHNGDLSLAKELVHAASDAGADVAKFQLYDARALFPREGNPWYDYNCQTELTQAQTEELAATCQQCGIEFMASVFDVERVGWTELLAVKMYKVASRSIKDELLLEALVQTGKPILASLGMWDQPDFPRISEQTSFLYCVSQYPTPLEALRLHEIDFTVYAGFSDHTVSLTASQVALARGAQVIEKHFTLDKQMYGPDHACSMTPEELSDLCAFRDDLSLMATSPCQEGGVVA